MAAKYQSIQLYLGPFAIEYTLRSFALIMLKKQPQPIQLIILLIILLYSKLNKKYNL